MKMNSLLQDTICGMNLKQVNPDLPSGIIEIKEGFLKSAPIPPAKDCFISGRFDVLSKLDDGTYAVIDFKISNPNEEKAQKFKMQLHAYKYALENPAFGPVKKISKMGLIIVSPETIEFKDGKVIFNSTPRWFDIKEDMEGFYDFIGEISEVLNGPMPEVNKECAWCNYRVCFHKPKDDEELQQDLPF